MWIDDHHVHFPWYDLFNPYIWLRTFEYLQNNQENSFSANNKQAMEVTNAFLDALVNAKKPNSLDGSLVDDSYHVYCVLKAETSPIEDFTRSIKTLSSLIGSKAVNKKDSDSQEFLGWLMTHDSSTIKQAATNSN